MANTGMTAGLAKLRHNVEQLDDDYEDTLNGIVIEEAEAGEVWMKAHARWKDDDGNRKDRVPGAARAGLNTVPDVGGDQKSILFSHEVDYGIWLETSQNGKFEIIMPAVLHIGNELMRKTEGSLSKGSNLRLSRFIEDAE